MALKRDDVVIYQGKDKLWYWRRRARNARTVKVAGEGFSSRGGAIRSAKKNNPSVVDFVVVTAEGLVPLA